MKQLFQNLKSGITELIECPYPQCKRGNILIQTRASLISLGTERMLVEFSKSGLIDKARQQPERVKQVFEKIKTDGLLPTVEAVRSRLDEPLPLGYCNAGVVVEVGDGVTEFSVGDAVVSNGPHAEIVSVPKNLVAKIPDGVSFEKAAFTVAASIGLQGVRLACPTLGEIFVVIGLGLIGQLTAQLAKAHGCRVIAFDLDDEKAAIARGLGIEAVVCNDSVEAVMGLTKYTGADAVIITASSKSEAIISQAARMSRKRGRIVLVGVVPLTISRAEFYEKELSFQVSCSYGPGRYDPDYEQGGNDYPLPFVRWTEKRNFSAVLQCMVSGMLQTEPLLTECVAFEKAPELYIKLVESKSIATVLTYPEKLSVTKAHSLSTTNTKNTQIKGCDKLGIIGSGNFTKMTLLPALKKLGIEVQYICSQTGTTGPILSKKFGIPECTTAVNDVLESEIKSVFITTRHANHTRLTLQALQHGKHVFVEKPLAVNRMQLEDIVNWFEKHGNESQTITVGFNRRYSPLAVYAREMLGNPPPQLNFAFIMNAGAIPLTHWLHNPDEGGRIIGEACHCIDLFLYFAQSPIVAVCASALGCGTNLLSDTVTIMLRCKNGSQGVVHYFSNGSKQYQKEQFQLFFNNKVITVDNFRSLRAYGLKTINRKLASADKGHLVQFETYYKFLQGKAVLNNTLQEHINVTEAAIAAIESLREKHWVDLKYCW
jgi:predicted dehydrogenase/threonine dehydrogenase-like Zn-dependent dehydrogenase